MHFYGVSLTLLLLDQLLKRYMTSILDLCVYGHCESIHILPIFKLMLLHNEGAAFSFLNDAGGWQRWFLVIVSSLVSVFIAVWLWRIRREQRLLSWALCLILGGALGNLVDRVLQGYVVDFLVFYYNQYFFPAFNLADAAISVGAGLMILDMILERKRETGNG